jgi:Circularly permutated YpsA SLOG family
MRLLHKIMYGGQTGGDRAALDRAIGRGIPHGGWCPAGRLAEDGPIDLRYQLKETPSSSYPQRTEWNVRDSDSMVVFSIEASLTGGSKKTVTLAHKHRKPVLHLSRSGGPALSHMELRRFITSNRVQTLNVAGPRASKEPEVAAFVRAVLGQAFGRI